AYNLTRGPQLLLHFLPVVRTRCIDGITANREKCRDYLEQSPSVVTALTPKIGYAKAAEIFKEAVAPDVLVPDVLLEKKVVTVGGAGGGISCGAVLGPLD